MAMITKGGKPFVTVTVAKDATPSQKYAAWELRHYLNLITSVSIPVGDETTQGPVLAVGDAAASLGVKACDKLGTDGFTIRTVGESLAIVGGIRGVLYGVYEFLEKLGCRFFTPECEKIPSIPELALPELDDTQVPVLEYRQHNYPPTAMNHKFAAKCRLNAGDMEPELGGGIKYAWFCHSFEPEILNPAEWYDTHPEYFSMVDGKRVKEFAQLCLTNPDVKRIAVEKVRAALRAKPDCRIISITQNDWDNHCTCPECAAIDAREGSSAGTMIEFVNYIAEAIEDEFPDVIVDTFAYQYTRPTPKFVKPRHNVCVRLCSIEACFAHPFETCDDESRWVKRPDGTTSNFIRDLEAWGKKCDRMYIWDYTTCFAHYPAPHPNWRVLQPNMKAFIKNGVKGVFEQACGAYGGSTDMNELRSYVLTKLLWNADCDVPAIIKEFTDFYYGAAAPFVREYMDTICDKCEKDNIHIGFNDQCDRAHLTDEMLDIYDSILDKAEAAVVGDPIRGMRVARIRLSIRWVRMKNNSMLKGIQNPDEINKFFEDWRAHGLTRIDEWACPQTTHRALLENVWRGPEYYHHWTEEGKSFITRDGMHH